MVGPEEQRVAVEGIGYSFDSGTGLAVAEEVGCQVASCFVAEYPMQCFAKCPQECLEAYLAVACHAVVVLPRQIRHQIHVRR
ncbi:MAG: hypothetical protein CL959_04945 [Euryarchaeota archaeon]|nr:hypothetical protein [Euryarchaeota archaeon]